MNNIRLLYVDLFCGAGGTSTGVEYARHNGVKCAQVVACVNHDKNAILSHQANHPHTLHFTEDIRTLELSPLVQHVRKMQTVYKNARLVLWASLECTNFSKAKGGQPRNADSRTLAEHLFRYIEALQPDYIQIENVEEFMCWGDLDAHGRPVSRDKGRCYLHWVHVVQGYGYDFDWRILNSADYGAYTSRRRFFGLFAKKGLPIAFPVQTHSKIGDGEPVRCGKYEAVPMFHVYDKWKAVKEVLDLDDEGESIFGRKKPLVEKTLERIYAGLIKFVAGGKDAFIVKYNSMNGKTGKYAAPGIDEPCPTVATQNRLGMAKVHFLSKQFGGDPSGKNISVEEPAGTITCRDYHAFVSAHYGNGFNTSVDAPAPTLTTKDRLGLVTSRFLKMQYGNGTPSSTDDPAPTVTTNPKHNLVTSKFLTEYYGGKDHNHNINEPCTTLTTRVRHYLVNPQFTCKGGSIDNPCFTLIARMDKMPPYLITTEEGVGIRIDETDSPMTVKIKEFMALFGIIDIHMRMLNIGELKRIMGFPTDYILVGTQAEQKKFIGNAVEVNMSRVLCEALCEKIDKQLTLKERKQL